MVCVHTCLLCVCLFAKTVELCMPNMVAGRLLAAISHPATLSCLQNSGVCCKVCHAGLPACQFHASESARCLQANRVHMSLAAHLVHHISAWCLWAACTGLIWVAIIGFRLHWAVSECKDKAGQWQPLPSTSSCEGAHSTGNHC